jgi:hypothetical protein
MVKAAWLSSKKNISNRLAWKIRGPIPVTAFRLRSSGDPPDD